MHLKAKAGAGHTDVIARRSAMELEPREIEEVCKTLYIRALKLLPQDVKDGFAELQRSETDATGRAILGTMVENIAVAERTRNLLCQDTGIPIYNVTIGRNVSFEGVALKEAIRRGCERATREHPLRSSVVHPITRKNEQTSCGPGVPIIHVDFNTREETVEIEMIPKGSGSENGSFLDMLIPADGVKAIKRFVIDKVIELGGRVCPPTIVGVGIGGTSDLCVQLAKKAATRKLRSTCPDLQGATIEQELSQAVNELGIGPQGLGGRSTAFAVHVEVAATHITMNPVAVNIQCHSARRAIATITPGGIAFT
jgi:tartrate/fumarate subfamily iron-sulfur-dependent hydro-lyase alpha chain